jgi:hypothetical protein
VKEVAVRRIRAVDRVPIATRAGMYANARTISGRNAIDGAFCSLDRLRRGAASPRRSTGCAHPRTCVEPEVGGGRSRPFSRLAQCPQPPRGIGTTGGQMVMPVELRQLPPALRHLVTWPGQGLVTARMRNWHYRWCGTSFTAASWLCDIAIDFRRACRIGDRGRCILDQRANPDKRRAEQLPPAGIRATRK